MRAVEGIFAIYDEAPDPSGESCKQLALPLRGHVGLSSALAYCHRSNGEGFHSGNEIVEWFSSIIGHARVDSLLEVQ